MAPDLTAEQALALHAGTLIGRLQLAQLAVQQVTAARGRVRAVFVDAGAEGPRGGAVLVMLESAGDLPAHLEQQQQPYEALTTPRGRSCSAVLQGCRVVWVEPAAEG